LNKQIRWVSLWSAMLVLALLTNLTYMNVFQQAGLEANDYNLRAREAEFDVQRGEILAGETVIAKSVEADKSATFRYQRVYTNGPLYAPITGFYAYNYGQTRIENSYNTYLSGTSSAQWWQNLVDMVSGRTPGGASVMTTIDPELQQAAWDALKGYQGAIVAMDPHTGAIKALVTSPSYDPNQIASADLRSAEAAYNKLSKDETGPMSDRGTREIFPPGSTFKLIVSATALEHGYSADTMIDTPDRLKLPGTDSYLPNSAYCGNTQVTLRRALELSCNTSFANLGVKLGADAVRAQAQKFGFGTGHLDELGGAASHFPDQVDDAQMMLSSIGQFDVAATPLQMAMVASAFVNDGKLAEPYLVQEVRAPDLRLLYSHEVTTTQAVSAETAKGMRDLMISVVNNGGGVKARISGVTVGGKSGTAESDPSSPNYAWFVSFALDPDIVVTVFLQRDMAKPIDLWGGADAAPVARAVLKASR